MEKFLKTMRGTGPPSAHQLFSITLPWGKAILLNGTDDNFRTLELISKHPNHSYFMGYLFLMS
jgi:hypothetical protein